MSARARLSLLAVLLAAGPVRAADLVVTVGGASTALRTAVRRRCT